MSFITMDGVWDMGKKIAIAGAVLVSIPVAVPVLVPSLFVLSVVGVALAVPVGSAAVGFVVLKKLLGYRKQQPAIGWYDDERDSSQGEIEEEDPGTHGAQISFDQNSGVESRAHEIVEDEPGASFHDKPTVQEQHTQATQESPEDAKVTAEVPEAGLDTLPVSDEPHVSHHTIKDEPEAEKVFAEEAPAVAAEPVHVRDDQREDTLPCKAAPDSYECMEANELAGEDVHAEDREEAVNLAKEPHSDSMKEEPTGEVRAEEASDKLIQEAPEAEEVCAEETPEKPIEKAPEAAEPVCVEVLQNEEDSLRAESPCKTAPEFYDQVDDKDVAGMDGHVKDQQKDDLETHDKPSETSMAVTEDSQHPISAFSATVEDEEAVKEEQKDFKVELETEDEHDKPSETSIAVTEDSQHPTSAFSATVEDEEVVKEEPKDFKAELETEDEDDKPSEASVAVAEDSEHPTPAFSAIVKDEEAVKEEQTEAVDDRQHVEDPSKELQNDVQMDGTGGEATLEEKRYQNGDLVDHHENGQEDPRSSVDTEYKSITSEFPDDTVSISDEETVRSSVASEEDQSRTPGPTSEVSNRKKRARLRKEIKQVEKVVGYTDAPHGSPAEELERLYDFLGIELPSGYESTNDPSRLLEALDVLKAVVGVK